MSQAPPGRPPGPPLKPHRGAMILVFGILGLVLCFSIGMAFAIAA